MARKRGGNVAHQRYDLNWGAPEYHFGDPAERAARTRNNQVQNAPTAFGQIGPSDQGGSLNSPSQPVKRGDLKFGHL